MILFQSIFILLFTLSAFQNDGWKFEFEKEAIKVYTKQVEGYDLKAFKGETTIQATVGELLNIIYDVEHYPQWCYKTSSTKLLKKEDNKIYYHYISETPPLVSNREAYFCSEVVNDKKTMITTVKMNIYHCNEPVPKGFVRIPYSNGLWILTPLNEHNTHVLFQMHADPGGKIPAWLANLAAVDSPWITLNNLRERIAIQ